MARIRSFLGIGQALGYPSPLSALPQAMNIIRSTSIDFAENQLLPILVGLSKPLYLSIEVRLYVFLISNLGQLTGTSAIFSFWCDSWLEKATPQLVSSP